MKLSGALAGAIFSMMAEAGMTKAMRFRGGKTNEVDISSVGEMEPVEPRQLQADADFSPLGCNSEPAPLASVACVPLPVDFSGEVPCGVCYSMSEFQAGGSRTGTTLSLGGLNILGRLDFPEGSKVTIETPNVYVQGLLSMTSTRAVTGEPDVKIRLTGETDNFFVPHTDNTAACASGSCNVGPKAFVVAGGQLDINGMPDSCPTWSHILDVGTADKPSPAEFPTQPDLPTTSSGGACSAIVLDEKFEGGLNTWYGNLGAYESVETGSHDGSKYLSITERTGRFQGPLFELGTAVKECILPDTPYFFKAKIRLSGSASQCATSGENCPELKFGHMDTDNKVRWRSFAQLDPGVTVVDGEWFDFKGVFRFFPHQLDIDDVWSLMTISGPEAGVDISVDDISLKLPDAGGYPSVDDVCGNLIVNGDASGVDGFVFPHYAAISDSVVEFKSDGSNDYFHLTTRDQKHDTLKSDLITGCLTSGTTYTFSAKFRVYTNSPVTIRPFVRTLPAEGGALQWDSITVCDPITAADGFVSCGPTDFTFTERHFTASSVSLVFIISDLYTDIDFDDISFVFKSGPPAGYALDSAVTSACWGAGAEVVLPSENLHFDNVATTTITSVGSEGQVAFADTILRTPKAQSADYAAEVALLSRNIVFESADETTIGPTLVVLNTKNVVQKIQGVSLKGFGQEGVLDRNPINFKLSGDLTGSEIKKNAINLSKNRCVNVHGTDGLYIGENVAYDTIGHCYALELGSEINNSFDKNIGVLTKKATTVASEETDKTPATFLITHPGNSWTGNVAAGSEYYGFWMDLKADVSVKLMNAFSDNTVHSTFHMGIKSWPTGWRPSEPQTLVNTKIYRNRVRGMFIQYSSNVTFDGGLVADCRHAVDVRLSDYITFKNFNIHGNTDDYMGIVNSRVGQPSHCASGTTGIRPHINVFEDGNDGTTLENVQFSFFARPECNANSVAIDIDSHFWKNRFTAPTRFSNIAFDTTESQDAISLCKIAAKGVTDIAILDSDGSFDPASGTGPGTIVSDDDAMTNGKTCVNLAGSCARYCQGDSSLTGDAVSASTPTSPTAPTPTAPSPAAPSPAAPTPTAPAPSPSTAAGPMPVPTPADELTVSTPTSGICLVNGDFESDDYSVWESAVTTANSVITNISPGFGSDTALKVTERKHMARGGPIQSFSTSCLSEDEWYEIRADVLAEDQGTANIFDCNPALFYLENFDGGSCPAISIFEPNTNTITEVIAYTVGTYNSNGWNQMYGVFKATSEIIAKGNLEIVVARAPTIADITVDNVVLSVAPPGAAGKTDCAANNLIFNGDAEAGDTRSWFVRGHDPKSRIEMAAPGRTGDGYCFKHAGERTRVFMGMHQHLDVECFPVGASFQISAWFYYFVTDAEGTETPAACQKDNVYLEDACPTFEIAGEAGSPSLGRMKNQETAPITEGAWNKYTATFTVTNELVASGKIWVTVHSVAPGSNYFLDDVQITPV